MVSANVCKQKMASSDSATSVRILNENVDKLTKLPDMVKAFEELSNEEVITLAVVEKPILWRGVGLTDDRRILGTVYS